MQAIVHGRTTVLHDQVEHDANRVSPESILRAAESGDAVAGAILGRAAEALGIGIANLVTILSPDRVIIGGSVAQLGRWLFEPVLAVVRQRCIAVPVERVQIVPAESRGDAGVVGAAVWAAEHADHPDVDPIQARVEVQPGAPLCASTETQAPTT